MKTAIHTEYSPLAKRVEGARDPKDAKPRSAWGILFHTTGSGITAKAKKTGKKPINVALAYYITSQNGANGYLWGGAHYVLDYDGTLWQLAPDNVVVNHCGGPDRAAYLNGGWHKLASKEIIARWHAQWGPRYKNPYELFPSKSPNLDYIGVEMLPIGNGFGGSPMSPGLLYTRAQHEAAVALATDCGMRHGWPTGWQAGPRLLGHEDVQPIARDDAGGGWDPGSLRAKPRFDFDFVRKSVA